MNCLSHALRSIFMRQLFFREELYYSLKRDKSVVF